MGLEKSLAELATLWRVFRGVPDTGLFWLVCVIKSYEFERVNVRSKEKGTSKKMGTLYTEQYKKLVKICFPLRSDLIEVR